MSYVTLLSLLWVELVVISAYHEAAHILGVVWVIGLLSVDYDWELVVDSVNCGRLLVVDVHSAFILYLN